MGLISRVSSRTYRSPYYFKNPKFSKWLTENPEPSFAETSHGTQPKKTSSPLLNSRTLLTSKSQPTERPADHEDSASSSSTPLRNVNKLWLPPKALKLMDEKLFSLKVNHEKLKAVAEAVTAVDEVVTAVDEVVTAVDEAVTKVETAVTKVETVVTKLRK